MSVFSAEERRAAALDVLAAGTSYGTALREDTQRLVANAWAQGELSYSISTQYAIELLCELKRLQAQPRISADAAARLTRGEDVI